MKPFFKPFFGAAMATRIGPIIGRATERKMLFRAGGPDGIVKGFRENPGGGRTMLKTRAGMPQFSTTAAVAAAGSITVTNENAVIPASDPNTAYLTHMVQMPASYGDDRSYSFAFIDDSDFSSDYTILAVDTFSDGVYGSNYPSPGSTPDSITVPAAVSSFTVSVTVVCTPYTDPSVRYRVFVGTAFGTGAVDAI